MSESNPQGKENFVEDTVFEVVNIKHWRVEPYTLYSLSVSALRRSGRAARSFFSGPPKEAVLKRYSRSNKSLKTFIPHNFGGKTEVTLKNFESGEEFVGTAYCSMSDPFVYKIGVQIALDKAFDLTLE